MRVFLITLFFLLIHTTVSQACYTNVEAEAEQGLRIHSELMVIGLTCIKMPEGVTTYNKYKEFTDNNADLINKYEQALKDYYEMEGYDNPEEEINNLRTRLANKISQYAVEMSVLSFCEMFVPRLDEAENMSSYQLSRWAKYAIKNTSTTEPMCNY